MAAGAPASSRWLFGPLPDLLLGCGVLYTGIYAAYALAGPQILSRQPALLLPLLVLVVSAPHYGGTLLRVYEERSERRAYALFSVWATLAVAVAFVTGLYYVAFGSWLATLYLTWSPWHYTGQNYGLAVMFLRRRGVALSPGAKRWLYASFVLSFGLIFLGLHGAGGSASYSPVPQRASEISFISLGIPEPAMNVLAPALIAAYLAVLGATAVLLLREAPRASDLLPTGCLVLTQGLWFSVPFIAGRYQLLPGSGALRAEPFLLWTVVGHAIQYLWVTSYYARSSPQWSGLGRYYAKVLTAGLGIWTVPVLLFGPGALGRLSYDAGLALMIASAVNIHHFILDGAIWKLRNSRIAGVLIRSDARGEAAPFDARPQRTWPRRAVWATAAVGTLAGFLFFGLDARLASDVAAGRLASASRTLDWLGWLGRDEARKRVDIGDRNAARGRLEAALREYERALELTPDSAPAHYALGNALEASGERDGAILQLRKAVASDPEHAKAHHDLGILLAQSGDYDGGLAHLRRAVDLDPDYEIARDHLIEILRRLDDAAVESAPVR